MYTTNEIYTVWQGGPQAKYMTGGITFTEAQCIKANTLPLSYIEAVDWRTVLYTHVILYGSVQQVNLSACNDWIGQIRRHFFTPCQCPKLYQPPCNTWTITVQYVWWLWNHREVKHYGGVPYKWDRLEQKMAGLSAVMLNFHMVAQSPYYIYYIVRWVRNRRTFCLKTVPKTMPFSR